MSLPALEAVRLGVEDGWLRGWLQRAPSPRAAVLLLPPLFHEWQRSYRLFALLSQALAERGVATLRFDYRGCGDSAGDDADFLPSRAAVDAAAMLQELRRRLADLPLRVLAIRGACLLGHRFDPADTPLWQWQPPASGAALLAELDALDAAELGSVRRYPFPALRQPRRDQLMGQRIHPQLRAELAALPPPAAARRIDRDGRAAELVLPPALADWVGQLGISGSFALPVVRGFADQWVSRMVAA